MKNKIEILAPAGSYETVKAVLNAGCDAIYIGGSSFGARAYADNPEDSLLLKAIDEVHLRDKKLYLTVNTLVKEKEMEDRLYNFLEKYYLQGLDAVIVQDTGVMNFIHKYFPDLNIHASTQATVTMAEGAELLKNTGVTRIVTPRELSLDEIKRLHENTDLEIETFVHGALCYCYSGQCLMSSMIGGRSGNRGRCAQPCRMPYELYFENHRISKAQEKYLLSPKDIHTTALIPELVEAGITSFKIEGRMKRAEYAAGVTSIYRKYVDLYFEKGKEKYQDAISSSEYKRDMMELMDLYNRGGFSQGYLKTCHGKSMMSMNRPNHSGIFVGEVIAVKGGEVSLSLKEDINAQDILEIRGKEEESYEFTVKSSMRKGEILTTYIGKRLSSQKKEVQGRNRRAYKGAEPVIRIGDQVYRTRNNQLLERIAGDYISKDQKLMVKGTLKAKKNENLTLTVTSQNCKATVEGTLVQEAMKQPVTQDKLSLQITKTGDTIYCFDELHISSDEDIFVPVSALNEIRREALKRLTEEITCKYRRNKGMLEQNKKITGTEIINQSSSQEPKHPEETGMSVLVQTMEQFEVAAAAEAVTCIYAEYDAFTINEMGAMAEKSLQTGKKYYPVLPHICRAAVYDRLKMEILSLSEKNDFEGYVVKNFEEIHLVKSLLQETGKQKEIILDYNMYLFNSSAREFWNRNGINHFTAPLELNYQELKNLKLSDCDMIVYGYQPLMVSAQCLFDNTSGCRRERSEEGRPIGYLVDRLGKKFFVQADCRGCFNRIYNGQCLSLHKQAAEVIDMHPLNIRLDFTFESADEMKKIMDAFQNSYIYHRKNDFEPVNYTAGHFNRGVE